VSALLDNYGARRRRGGRFGLWLNRPGVVPGGFGATLVAALALARLVVFADLNSVKFAGHALAWGCWFRQQFGVPCPFCGLTRSTLLALQGQLSSALQVNPAGPVLVFGLLTLGCALIGVALSAPHRAARLRRRTQVGATVYAALFFFVLFAHWLLALGGH
jgi:hypothetical protein